MPSMAGPPINNALNGGPDDGDHSALSILEHSQHRDRVQINWTAGSELHVSLLTSGQAPTVADTGEGGSVFRVQWNALTPKRRRLAFESLPHFAFLQKQKQAALVSACDFLPDASSSSLAIWSPDDADASWQHYVDYSESVSKLLWPKRLGPPDVSEETSDDGGNGQVDVEVIASRAVWDLVGIAYVQSGGERNVTECLVDWLMEHGRILTASQGRDSIHNNVMKLREVMMSEEYPECLSQYWDGVVACVAVGWLDTACTLLRRHSAFHADESAMLDEEAGVVEVAIKLLEEMPRLRTGAHEAPALSAGTSFVSVAEFTKTLDRWRGRLARLEAVPQWQKCSRETMDGLKRLLDQLLGRREVQGRGKPLASAGHWIELLVSHLLHFKPHTQTVEGLEILIRKSMNELGVSQTKQPHFDRLLLAILARDTETVLAKCSRSFDSWMMVHIVELLTARNQHARSILTSASEALGGISLDEMYRQQYAQELLSHGATWQLAPTYLACCPQNGMAVLQTALERLPFRVGDDHLVLKALDVCSQFSLDDTATAICRKVGVQCWKQKRRGGAIAWLQRAHDDARLSSIADSILAELTSTSEPSSAFPLANIGTLLDNVGSGALAPSAGALGFLKRFLDLLRALDIARSLRSQKPRCSPADLEAAGARAATAYLQLLRPEAAPPKFWAFLLSSGIELLDWPEGPLIGTADTLALISQLQEVASSHEREEKLSYVNGSDSEAHLLEKVRLALAQNLGRAILQHPTAL